MNSPKIISHIKINLEMLSLTLVLLGANDAPAIGVKSELTCDESGWLNEKRKDIIGFLQNELSQDVMSTTSRLTWR